MVLNYFCSHEFLVALDHLHLTKLRGEELKEIIGFYLDVDEVEKNLSVNRAKVADLTC